MTELIALVRQSEVGLGINVVGRDGKTVTEQWKRQGGPQAYLGTTISNYPNFYSILFVLLPNSPCLSLVC